MERKRIARQRHRNITKTLWRLYEPGQKHDYDKHRYIVELEMTIYSEKKPRQVYSRRKIPAADRGAWTTALLDSDPEPARLLWLQLKKTPAR